MQPEADGLVRRRVAGLLAAAAGALALPALLRRDGPGRPPRQLAPDALAAIAVAAARRNLCSSTSSSGVGLRGEYFSTRAPGRDPFLVRTDAAIDLDAHDLAAIRGAHRQRAKSARWTGWVKPIVAGDYGFALRGAPGRVVVSRQLMAGAEAARETRITLDAGRLYFVCVEAEDLAAATTRLQLEWQPPYGAQRLLPQVNLYPPVKA